MSELLNTVIQGDCLEVLRDIPEGSIDLVLCDLPYGIMQPNHQGKAYREMYGDKLRWDTAIPTEELFRETNRVLRKNGKALFFSQEPYTSKLIYEAIPNLPFNYKYVWKKDTFGSHLKCNIAPLGFYEEILAFTKRECPKAVHPLREVFRKYVTTHGEDFFIRLFETEGRYSSKQSARVHAAHKLGFNNGARFDFMDKKMYEYLTQFIEFSETYEQLEELDKEYKGKYLNVFNLPEDTKYKSNVLEYKKDKGGLHPTQKPVMLLEDLINTHSNPNDTVLDFTCGSGSTLIAAINTNRQFIGIEREPDYVAIANQRIIDAIQTKEATANVNE